MKRLFLSILILFLVSFFISSKVSATYPDVDELNRKVSEILTPAVSVPENLPPDFHPVCATPHFIWIPIYASQLDLDSRKKFQESFARPDSSYTVPESTYNTPSGNFKIHFVTSSVDSVYQSHVDESPADGVPDYVNLVGTILDYVWVKEVDTLGFNQPPSDSWYTLYGYDNGGDGRYDVYLMNLDYYYLGYTQSDYSQDDKSYCSFFVLRNDYSLYGINSLNYLKTTAAHEFFHAIQFGYDIFEQEYVPSDTIFPFHPYWMEITSTWMEDVIYDNINDYVAYLPAFYNYPWLSLKTFSYDSDDIPRYYHAYASCVWAIYLSEKFGTGIIKDIWARCGQTRGDDVLNVTDSILISKGSSLEQAFREFSVWNYYTKGRADTLNYYSEGSLYPLVKFDSSQIHHSMPVNINSVPYPPEVLGTNYINFVADETKGGLNLSFNGADLAKWKVSVIGHSVSSPEFFTEFSLNTLQDGTVEFHNWNFYDNIIMIPAVVTKTSGSFNYSYSATYDSTLTEVKDLQELLPYSFELSQNYPNPFNSTTILPFEIRGSQSMYQSPVHTTLIIYNILGQTIRTMLDQELKPGNYQVIWDGKDDSGKDVSSGIYLYQLKSRDYTTSMKMLLLR
ncbi:MAG: DUF6055 domain-containing protein [candidate division Zixibacteria bacterium]|nr:DUF6055 domain-containing protein [candidate division Zixibacteria bacterium]